MVAICLKLNVAMLAYLQDVGKHGICILNQDSV